jgi:aminomethyltransferase
MMLKQTPLNGEHRRLGARLTDFGGWEMPLHYGSQIEEHHRVRRAAGMFDVSHMLAIDARGAAARALLRAVLANDVARLPQPGRALYSCMLADDGGVLDDLIVYYLSDKWYRLVVNAGTAQSDLAWLQAQRDRLAPDATLEARRDLAIIAVQGPQAREQLWRAWPRTRTISEPLANFDAAAADDLFVARTGYTGEDGFEVIVPADQAVPLWRALHDAGVAPCGLGARDTLRLEAGMNLYGQEMDTTVTPMEAGLAWTVSLAGGRDFIGRAALERRPTRFGLYGLLLEGRGVLRAHQAVRCTPGDGVITSGTFSPTLNQSIALARLPLGVRAGDMAEVQIRDQWLPARVVKYPFVRHGKSLLPQAGQSLSNRASD